MWSLLRIIYWISEFEVKNTQVCIYWSLLAIYYRIQDRLFKTFMEEVGCTLVQNPAFYLNL